MAARAPGLGPVTPRWRGEPQPHGEWKIAGISEVTPKGRAMYFGAYKRRCCHLSSPLPFPRLPGGSRGVGHPNSSSGRLVTLARGSPQPPELGRATGTEHGTPVLRAPCPTVKSRAGSHGRGGTPSPRPPPVGQAQREGGLGAGGRGCGAWVGAEGGVAAAPPGLKRFCFFSERLPPTPPGHRAAPLQRNGLGQGSRAEAEEQDPPHPQAAPLAPFPAVGQPAPPALPAGPLPGPLPGRLPATSHHI